MMDKFFIYDYCAVSDEVIIGMHRLGYHTIGKQSGTEVRIEPQMTLRDQFAAAAMTRLAQEYTHPEVVARKAYELADAMLAARETEVQNQNKE